MDTKLLKKQAAEAAISYVESGMVIGIGTGSTINYFIELLSEIKSKVDGAIASSVQTEQLLKKYNIPVISLNEVRDLPLYVDGCDQTNRHLQLVKGGGGALTREKIIASASKQFICIADSTKKVDILGQRPIAVEVIPMARSYVAREIVKLDADPVYRPNFVTDNGNVILDIHRLEMLEPRRMEEKLNHIAGVVCNGIFAARPADTVLLASESGVEKL